MTENEKTSATEMTENEIIKALESCNALVKMRTCKTCPLYTFEGCCTAEMLRQTVNLIKRKDEQIESLIAGQETLQKYIVEKDAEIERLKNSGIRAKSVEDWLDFCNELKAKAFKDLIEELTDVYAHCNLNSTISIDVIFCDIKRIAKEMVGEG